MCDNLGVVQAVNSKSAKSCPVVSLLQQLVLWALELNAQFVVVHVPGVSNSTADSLSRFQGERFQELAPGAEVEGIFGIWFDHSHGSGTVVHQCFYLGAYGSGKTSCRAYKKTQGIVSNTCCFLLVKCIGRECPLQEWAGGCLH